MSSCGLLTNAWHGAKWGQPIFGGCYKLLTTNFVDEHCRSPGENTCQSEITMAPAVAEGKEVFPVWQLSILRECEQET